jgi:nucleoside-diphosphate-sugar epimerase
MKVFVTGGTGVLGVPAIRMLRERGHGVVALAHSARSVGRLRDAGVEVIEGQLFDAALIRQATAGVDAILHLATRIPPSSEMSFRAAWNENDRIRTEGTNIVVDAAIANEVEVIVYPGIIFVYPDSGERWIDAGTPVREPLSDSVRTALDAEANVERFAQTGKRGVTLRLGLLYGPSSGHTQESVDAVRQGVYITPGPDDAYLSSLWIDDAAAAIVAAMERAPSGVYDVVDDEPLSQRELREVVTAAAGHPLTEQTLDDLLEGAEIRPVTEQSRRVSNARFKELVGWQPTVRSPREGWRRLLQPVGV